MTRMLPLNSDAALVSRSGAGMPEPPAPNELRDWRIETYDLDVTTAASLGFGAGQIAMTGRRRVFILESSRSRDLVKDGHSYRFGVALRVVVEVGQVSGSGALTLPVLAAKVELEGAHATSRLVVRGYRGDDLGPLIPVLTTFGVEEYGQYLTAITALQARIMSSSDAIDPELLAASAVDNSAQLPTAAESVALVYGLDSIAQGIELEAALRNLPELDPQVVDVVREVYKERVGEGDRTQPDVQESEQARQDLSGLRLSHGLFGIRR